MRKRNLRKYIKPQIKEKKIRVSFFNRAMSFNSFSGGRILLAGSSCGDYFDCGWCDDGQCDCYFC